jgi:hypothetical protein
MTGQPAGVPPFTKTMMLDEAGDVLEQWLDGYTYPSDEDHAAGHQQRRMHTTRTMGVFGNTDARGMDVTVNGEGEPVRKFRLTLSVDEVLAEVPKPDPAQVWRLEGYDTFSSESYPLGNLGRVDPYKPFYGSYEDALAAARNRLAELDKTQPSAGGQGGIQDQVRIVHPDGRRERVS